MSEKTIFLYIFLTTNLNPEFKEQIETYYWGGIIEAFISCEEQWIDPKDIWPFGWEQHANRNSIVQITEDFDPMDTVLKILSKHEQSPVFQHKLDNEENHIIGFKPSFLLQRLEEYEVIENKYSKRFYKILEDILSVAKRENSTLFIIGGDGFSLDLELDLEDQMMFKKMGISFYSRTPFSE